MKNKDPNHIVKIEKAIADKYGEDTIQNPKAHWNDEKEKEYVKQLKDLYIEHMLPALLARTRHPAFFSEAVGKHRGCCWC